jgi:hypothetical protein
MKKLIRFSWINSLIGVILCSILLSFSTTPGAHNFQVYLDNKLMIDQYVNLKMNVPTLRVDPADNYSQLIVKYNECGRKVTGRKITVKDDQNNVLKDWTFEGASSGYEDAMTCKLKDVIAVKQNGSNTLKLFYSSKEFPEGQQLANLVISPDAGTALR